MARGTSPLPTTDRLLLRAALTEFGKHKNLLGLGVGEAEESCHLADRYTFPTSSAMFDRLVCPLAAVCISALIAALTCGTMLL